MKTSEAILRSVLSAIVIVGLVFVVMAAYDEATSRESLRNTEARIELERGAREACNAISIKDVDYNIKPLLLKGGTFSYLVETEDGGWVHEQSTSTEFSAHTTVKDSSMHVRYSYELDDKLRCNEVVRWKVYFVNPELFKTLK